MRRTRLIARLKPQSQFGRFALVALVIVAGLLWHGVDSGQNGWMNMTQVCAGERVSLGNLPQQLDNTAIEYKRVLSEFRTALSSGTGQSPGKECDDPQLIRYTAQCYRLWAKASSLYGQILARVGPNASREETGDTRRGLRSRPDAPDMRAEDHLALASATRTFHAMEPGETATVELAKIGDCGMKAVGNLVRQVQKDEEKARQQAKEDRASFLGGLLKDALGDAEANGEDPNAPTATPGTDQPESGEWNQARFTVLYRQFMKAYREFKTHARNFLDRLDLLASSGEGEGHHICEDPTLAYSFAQANAQSHLIAAAYAEAQVQLVNAAYNSVNPPIEDQIAYGQMGIDLNNAEAMAARINSDLDAKGAGCDPEDLEDAGRRTAEPGQDAETGVDGGASTSDGGGGGGGGDGLTANFSATPTTGTVPLTVDFTDLSYGGDIDNYLWAFGDGGSSIGTNPAHTYRSEGTYDVSLTVSNATESDKETKAGLITVGNPDLRYERVGEPDVQVDNVGRCPGSTLDLGIMWPPTFLTPYRWNRTYQIQITVTWTYRGQRPSEAVFGASVTFLGVTYTAEQVTNPRSTYTFKFNVSTADVDFSQETQVVSVAVGGYMVCEGGTTSDDVAIVYTQVYQRAGGN